MNVTSRIRNLISDARAFGSKPAGRTAGPDRQESGQQITREHVIWAYRLFLDREPENEAVVSANASVWDTTEELRAHFLSSQEFQSKNPDVSIRVLAPDGLPIPPASLITLVAGIPDVSWFIKGGELATRSIVDTLEKNGIAVDDLKAILDFGCGCGRVTRHWRSLSSGRICGSDYNPELVDWCADNLDFAEFRVNDLTPPLSFEDATFDFVYALSVFTHLPEDLQAPWMQELARVLRPGGFLLFTAHGEHYLNELTPDEKERFKRGQLVVHYEEHAGTNQCGAFHPKKHVYDELARGFTVADFVAEGAKGNPYQDVYLLTKNPKAA
jgi:SAM-dependent methyltransferase